MLLFQFLKITFYSVHNLKKENKPQYSELLFVEALDSYA